MVLQVLAVVLSLLFRSDAETVELRMGGAIGLTGSLAVSGVACLEGWTLWAKRANELGGIRLASGDVAMVKLPLDLRDDTSNSAYSQELLRKMLNASDPSFADLHFVIGPFSSGYTANNAMVAAEFKKILFSHGASEGLYNKKNGYIFSVLTPGGKYMSSGLDDVYSRGARSVVIMHEEKSFSFSVCRGANTTAHELGMDVRGYSSYPPGTKNFAKLVNEAKMSDADVVVGCGHKTDINYLIAGMVLIKLNPKAVLVTHANENARKDIGGRSLDLLSPTQWHKDLDFSDDDDFFGTAADYDERYSAEFGSSPIYQAAYSSAMGYALQKAIEATGTMETEAVRAALYDLEVNSFYGPIDFSAMGDESELVGSMPRRPMVTTQIQRERIRVVAPAYAASTESTYPARTWAVKDLIMHPCREGQHVISTGQVSACVNCSAGQYRDSTLPVCVGCGMGSYMDRNGSRACELCPKGMHASKAGMTQCVTCEEGTQAVERGASSCAVCRPGHFKPTAGVEECARCPEGTFSNQPRSTQCTGCPAGKVTNGLASISEAECVCKVGMYFKVGVGCVPCPEGITCRADGSMPSQDEGYYVEVHGPNKSSLDDFSVYKCRSKAWCLQGSFARCSEPRAGRACAVCGTDQANPGSECPTCAPWVPPVFLLCGLAICVAAYVVTDRRQYGTTSKLSALTSNCAIALTIAQNMNIVIMSRAEIPLSLKFLADFTETLMFRWDLLAQGCDFGASFIGRILFLAFPPVGALLAFVFLYLLFKALGKVKQGLAWNWDATINAVGTIFTAFDVMLCKIALGAFVVLKHPLAPDTLAHHPDVIIGDDIYMSGLWIIMLIALVYICGIVTFSLVAILKAPKLSWQGSFRRRFRFFFAPWRPHMWYWGLVALLRNVLINLVPLLVSHSEVWKSAAFMAVFLSYMCLLCIFEPWAYSINNSVEIALLLPMTIMTPSLVALDDRTNFNVKVMFMGVGFAALCSARFAIQRYQGKAKNRDIEMVKQLIQSATDLHDQTEELQHYDQLRAEFFSKPAWVVERLSWFERRMFAHALDTIRDNFTMDSTTTSGRRSFNDIRDHSSCRDSWFSNEGQRVVDI